MYSWFKINKFKVIAAQRAPAAYALPKVWEVVTRWHVSQVGQLSSARINWPPYSSDITPLDFHLWNYVDDLVYFTPPPRSTEEHKDRIRNAVMTVGQDTLQRGWDEIAFRCDVFRVTKGTHTEHLWPRVQEHEYWETDLV